MSKWPKDSPEELSNFYGDPGSGAVENQLVTVVPPFTMYYDGKPIRGIRFHRKAAAALKAALDEIWEAYGRSQTKIDAAGVSKYGGSYNPRKIAGSNKWSNHAYGAAIDLDPDRNGFNTGHGTMPAAVVAAFKRQGARWGGDYKGRTDPMHFEFCDNGQPDAVPLPKTKPIDPPQVDSDTDKPEPKVPEKPKTPDKPDTPEPEDKPEPKKPEPKPATKDEPDEPDDPPVPWWKRAWTWVAGSLFGGGMTVGGITLDAKTILALCLLVVILGVMGFIYLRYFRNK